MAKSVPVFLFKVSGKKLLLPSASPTEISTEIHLEFLKISNDLIKKLKFIVILCYFSTFLRGTFRPKQTESGFLKNSGRKSRLQLSYCLLKVEQSRQKLGFIDSYSIVNLETYKNPTFQCSFQYFYNFNLFFQI